MKFLVALTLLALGSQCLARPTNDHDHHWERFKVLYNKNYHGEEDQVRKTIFEERLNRIVQHNLEYDLGIHSYYRGINEFSDMTRQERLKYKKGLIPSDIKEERNLYEYSGDIELPASLDWRTKGYVTEVKNQRDCGSCWAFSTTGALEGQHYRKTGKLVSLSEQNLLDCSTVDGCGGGLMLTSYYYIINNHGIDTEESYPYLARDNGPCGFNNATIGATCKNYKIIAKNENILQEALVKIGPISIGINCLDSFMDYKGGVYNDPECEPITLDHAMLLVGYGTDNGKEYWLVKNSWGKKWGEHGYIRMTRNKNNQCGIASSASYPIV